MGTKSSGREARGVSRVDMHQSTLRQHFMRATDEEYAHGTRREFRRHRKKMRKTRRQEARRRQHEFQKHSLDRTIGLMTINVRGLATHMDDLGTKLQGLKEAHARGQRDLVFIQETHLNKEEHGVAAGHFAAMWGFRYTEATKLSMWSSGTRRRAGVAILVNPYGAVSHAEPWREDLWSEHLIMMKGVIADREFIFVNIYAPSLGAVRIDFFTKLRTIPFPEDVEVICGGDFNCVLNHEVDRIGGTALADPGAKTLAKWMDSRSLVDAGYYNIPRLHTHKAVRSYANQHHTHRHTAADGSVGTSRIDRWNVGAAIKKLVRGVVTEEAQYKSDHRAVLMELHFPDGAVRMKKRPKIYPPPQYVYAATKSLVDERLKTLGEQFGNLEQNQMRVEWGAFKDSVKNELVELKKKARLRTTRGYRQRIKRLKVRLSKLEYGGARTAGDRAAIVTQLNQVQDARRIGRKRVLISSTAWSSKQSTKQFFRRICTKFSDNTIPTLKQGTSGVVRTMHDKANILADNWEPIFNGVAQAKESIEEYVGRLAQRWNRVDLQDIDADITEEEVMLAINRCKAGKTCGPDDLGNEWYKDNAERLVPILTQLFNSCMKDGRTPHSFLEAFIFSVSKGGDRSNPLNYRPIALLNTDYKIFTRILAWRVRKHISKLVHETQCGFVPGKTIHEVIDLFEAAKAVCREGKRLTKAQVLLLDFAKAYDSLDRDFLLTVLQKKGFPERFCKIVATIHAGTTVKFMANGQLSRALNITSGIRQGCPLAPLLFILAVDLLYDEVDMDAGLVGIALDSKSPERQLKAAGYADDTAIYIADKSMQATAIAAVARFSAASGLQLNVGKSAAISLGRGSADTESPEDIDWAENGDGVGEGHNEIAEIETTRYLGHIAGNVDTVKQAWTAAFKALTIRLELAQVKTNTVQQRAAIAAAIIVPKLMFVARHAWPSEDLAKEANWRIRNFVWKASFALPERAP